MSRGINKTILVGNCGDDPTVRYMPNGNAVANVTLATSESYKDKNTGQAVDKVEWHKIIFFGKLAEIVGEYVRKGSQIYVEGKLQTRKWTDQQGVERYTTEIVVDGFTGQMQMLGQRQQGQNGNQQQSSGYQGGQQSQAGYAHQQNSQQQSQGGHAQGGYTQQQSAPQQGGNFAPRQQSAPQQRSQQQGGVSNNQYMNGGQQGGPSNPMSPPIDFDDDIPFAPIGLQYPALLMCM